MQFARAHWTSAVILFALILSFVVQQQDSDRRAEKIRSALVVACVGDSQRTALNAAGFTALSERVGRRGKKGDTASAKRYRAVAAGVITLIPAPIGQEGSPKIATVVLIDRPGQEPRFRITEGAAAIQRKGCEDFYGVG